VDDKRGLASYRRLELLLGIRLSEPVQLRGVILQEHVGLQGLLVHFQLGFMKTPAKAREIRRRRRRGGSPAEVEKIAVRPPRYSRRLVCSLELRWFISSGRSLASSAQLFEV
jgi:hypothetical protein